MSLKYLFECHFNDGTRLLQTPEDVSSIDPTRSAFYDVVQRLDDVDAFVLYEPGPNIVPNVNLIVDLKTGLFSLNGVPFLASNPSETIPPDSKFRLVYFRRHTHITNGDGEQISHDTEYHLGWQTTVDGKNYQQTIAIG
jgi:hypothetical protein